ncbi:MAG: hypothetical protein EXS59_02200 [Candidatus Taylorbacteria bacterium]|nr:hypothetical protein [Candidatus Taylorbacteria bacterium]
MPPEESTPQQAPESPTPATETPPAPAEAVPAPETAQPTTQTGQIPPNEPLPPEPEPFDSAPDPAEATTGRQDKPTPEPPSAAAPVPTGILHTARDLLDKARVVTQDRKRKKRDKIMFMLNTKNKITNDEVEKLLHVSDATATRYLSALEKENKIKQVGKTGTSVVYSKI